MNEISTARILALTLFLTGGVAAGEEQLIPRSNPDDTGKYYLLEKTQTGTIVRALSKRVGADHVGYSLTETNCASMQMRVLGYSDSSAKAIKRHPTEWFDLEPGTSKSDLAKFVCG